MLIISGDTGCGKTTQVPKYILEQARARDEEVHIICTQPRRIAAMSIAKRVALEMGERIGELVGYQVGMESRTSPRTRVTFMTTGIFLMRLVNDPDRFEKYTHVIMDEVHERDLDIDFSLVVIKHLLCRMANAGLQPDGLKFKLILMSATFNTELFRNYFSKKSIESVERVRTYEGVAERYAAEEAERQRKLRDEWGPAGAGAWAVDGKGHRKEEEEEDEWVEEKPDVRMQAPLRKAQDPSEVVEINARPFQVKDYYLCDIIRNVRNSKSLKLSSQDAELINEAFEFMHSNKPVIKEGVMRIASIVICDVIERLNEFGDDKSEGAEKKSILVFLPGYHEIFEFIELIKQFYPEKWLSNYLEIIPLHSSLSQEEQDRAFRSSAFMKGRRKVIVATNIAESSITIPDIKYVIDFMLTKDVYYDPVSKSESL